MRHPLTSVQELKTLLQSLNGVIFPGGGTDLDHGPYRDTADIVYAHAEAANAAGAVFPLWGTCH